MRRSHRLASSLPVATRRKLLAEQGVAPPKPYKLLSLSGLAALHVCFTDFDRGHFIVKARSLRKAYELATAVRSFYYLMYSHPVEFNGMYPMLVELDAYPNANWTEQQLMDSICRIEGSDMRSALDYAPVAVTSEIELRFIVTCVPKLIDDVFLRDAAQHLAHSRFVFNGLDRGLVARHVRVNRRGLEKAYLENRAQYELSFLAAFKGLERLLRTGQIKRPAISRLLAETPYKKFRADSEYRRLHEVGPAFAATPAYFELVAHFLDIRNSVAAHANPHPNRAFVLRAATILEIQRFLEILCYEAMGYRQQGTLPGSAVVRCRPTYGLQQP